MNPLLKLSFGGAILLALAACSSVSVDEVETTHDALRVPTADEILGDITYGETHAVAYTEVPSFRAFRLAGKQGDALDVWARSPSGGDAVLWLVRQDGRTLAKNDDADGTTSDAHLVLELPRTETYFIVLRDANYEDNDFEVSLLGGGGGGAAVPDARIGTSFSAPASCSFLIEWATYQSPGCGEYGYGWGEEVLLSFAIEGTSAAPELVARPFSLEKQVATWGEKRTIGWPETRIRLDPATGAGKQSRRSHSEGYGGGYCRSVAKGDTTWSGTVTGDKLTFDMFESMQTNSCCSARKRTARCTLTLP
jgi:hypothetical protein